MQKIDVHTIIIILFLGNLLFACLLAVFKSKTISRQLYRQFIIAKVLQSVAWFLLALRGDIPDLFSAYFGNTFLSIGLTFEALAITSVYKKNRRREIVYLVIILVGIILLWFLSEKPNMRIFISSIIAAVIYSVASIALLGNSFNSLIRKTIGVIYSLLSIFLFIRSGYAFFANESFGLNTPNLIQSLTFIATFILMVVSGAGFQTMLSEYNDSIMDESNRMFENAMELLPIGCIIVDKKGIIKYLNNTFTKQFDYTIDDIPTRDMWFEKAYPNQEYRKLAYNHWKSDIERLNNLNVQIEPFVFSINSKKGATHVIEFRQAYIGELLMILLIDITASKKAEQALKKSEEKYKEAQFIGNIGHWEYNFANQKLHWSDQMYRIYELVKDNYEPELNKAMLSVHQDDQEALKNQFQFSLQNKTSIEIESRIITSKGETKHIISRVSPTFDKKGNPISMLGSVVDITIHKKAEQIIKHQNDELLKLNTDKDRFIQILAHDLRNPFSALLGFSDLLLKNLRDYSPEKIEKQLKIINDTSLNTFNLLDDLLLWSKSQAGKLSYEPQILIFNEICTEIISNLKYLADTKEISIFVTEPETIILNADLNMFKTILRNLISNAIKFTNENGKIDIKAEKTLQKTIITVSDSGVGINKEDQIKLWDFTKPISTTGTNGEKGTGFGLLLCKEFVEKHGGEIWVESEMGKGSAFKFTLPLS